MTDVCDAPCKPLLVALTQLFVSFFQLPCGLSVFQTYANAQLSTYFLVSHQAIQFEMEGENPQIWYRWYTGYSLRIGRTYFHLKKVHLDPIVQRSMHAPM